jgi:histidinol phosphatase-like enzyme (inositol monophosphatase family)
MKDRQSDYDSRLEFARDAALDAARIILGFYQDAGLNVERKRDASPVTIADRRAEQAIREGIAKHFPNDGVLGEEFGETAGTSGYRWVLDPLDGTKSFIHGTPLFGTLIGVEHHGRCVVGVCNFPVLNEMAWGSIGDGAWWRTGSAEPKRACVSNVAELSQALLCFTTVQGFSRIGRADAFDTFVQSAGLVRGWGDCYGHILVATGRADVMVDPLMNPWDAAALVPIVQEAGGCFMDWQGETSINSGNGISVNAALREEVLRITRRVKSEE